MVTNTPQHYLAVGAFLMLSSCVHRTECLGDAINANGVCVFEGSDTGIDAGADGAIDALVDVPTGVTDVAIGRAHICVIGGLTSDQAGRLYCRGENESGQLGTMGEPTGWSHVPFEGVVQSVAARENTTCAIVAHSVQARQRVWCWGQNNRGQATGAATAEPVLMPFDIYPDVTQWSGLVVSQRASCAIVEEGPQTGQALCWGAPANVDSPPQFMRNSAGVVLTNVSSMALGDRFGCAVISGGDVYCWGVSTGERFETDGVTSPELAQLQVMERPVDSLSASHAHICFIEQSDFRETTCRGNNSQRQIVAEILPLVAPPRQIGMGVDGVVAGALYTCVMQGGGVRCKGRNDRGQLGRGTLDSEDTGVFLPVVGLNDGVTLSTNAKGRTCAIREEGGVLCWGGTFAQEPLGVPSTITLPTDS